MGEVTAAIRELLAKGLTSGEIIGMGYRPGTVYKVQRSAKLGAAMTQQVAPPSNAGQQEAEELGAQEDQGDERFDFLEEGLYGLAGRVADVERRNRLRGWQSRLS